ncbi:uncharacterized protein K444DRAFT_662122 [Hyaloscypha bicolor E]|uniref:Uncharacterized protein n=1 Tax=Hyaloscypha bicolor E TaxID=1095630 RepID=A0A2J6TFZ2_9HELO|nr:uncharacterized protein K444DRAFT_662122 [Hyaloscypha bicolor E]PMD61947.1 hypothetical protein K444DRAFT_662122 [Hyaloscypha bicolor E]
MTGYKRVFLGCWVSLDEQDRLCEVSLDSSIVEEVSGLSDQQIDSIFQAYYLLVSCPPPSSQDTPRGRYTFQSHHYTRRHPLRPIKVAANANTPPQSPPQRPEKRPRPDSYTGITTRGSGRTKKVSLPRRRGGSRQNSSQEKIDSLRVSDDLNHSATTSTSPGEIPSPPQSVMLEEHSPPPNNDMALVDSHLPVESSASIVEENLQHVSPAPEPFPTDEKADLAVSTNELVTTSGAATGSASSITLISLPEADTQPECLDQTCPLVACTHPVSTVESTDSPQYTRLLHLDRENLNTKSYIALFQTHESLI